MHPDLKRPDHLATRVDDLRAELRQRRPEMLARHAGATYEQDENGEACFRLLVWGEQMTIRWPGFVARDSRGRVAPSFVQALLAYYFHTCDGTEPTGRWISFSELPDGTFYVAAFGGYTGGRLQREFGDDTAAFERAAIAAGGQAAPFADSSFVFSVLPYVSLLVACWQGDEEFPSSYSILFDEAAGHHLTTDACAVLGSALTKRLVKAASPVKKGEGREL